MLFSNTVITSSDNFIPQNKHADHCAKILLFADKNRDIENDWMEHYYAVLAANLENNLSATELEKYEEALSTPEMQKFLHVLMEWCGGPYNFFPVIVGKFFEAYKNKQHYMNHEELCLSFHELCFAEQQTLFEESSQDFYKQIVSWLFDFEDIQDLILTRQSECSLQKFSHFVEIWGWSEKLLLLTGAHAKVTLTQFYFVHLMLHALQTETMISFKEALDRAEISAHEIIKVHKFMHSPLGRKVHEIYVDSFERLAEDFLERVQF
jgi:hypothetical protein